MVWFGLVWFGKGYTICLPLQFIRKIEIVHRRGRGKRRENKYIVSFISAKNLCHHTKVYNRSEIYQKQVCLSSLSVYSYKATRTQIPIFMGTRIYGISPCLPLSPSLRGRKGEAFHHSSFFVAPCLCVINSPVYGMR